MPTVHAAWSQVMEDVQAIRKADANQAQRYMFRGIDAVMNAVGPALRRHGVHIAPIDVVPKWRDVQTTNGKPSRECTVVVTYRVTGPDGDYFDGVAPGESMDFGDKGAPKAMSVAYRTFLLQALCVPTDDPEPDAATYEREHPAPAQHAQSAAAPQQPMADKTRRRLFAMMNERGITDQAAQLAGMVNVIGHPLESRGDLTEQEAARVIEALKSVPVTHPAQTDNQNGN